MDAILTSDSGTTETTGTAVTTESQQTGDQGQAAPEQQQSEGGASQEASESGQSQSGGRRKWSIQDEVKELRAQRRELREQLRGFQDQLEELRNSRSDANRQDQKGNANTPDEYWRNPGAYLEERLSKLRDDLFGAFQTTREEEYRQQVLRQEQASAAEYIRSQQGYDPSDDEDLVEIIENIRGRENLSPQMVAEYAWMKLQQTRGIGDRSIQKQRASTVQGQPPGQSLGRKTWSRSEFDAAVDALERAPNDPKNAELLKELELAYKEGRVR